MTLAYVGICDKKNSKRPLHYVLLQALENGLLSPTAAKQIPYGPCLHPSLESEAGYKGTGNISDSLTCSITT
jgi:hypothetical protein